MNLPKPFDGFREELKSGHYKDFQIDPEDPYPLKGATYPTRYGDIEGYFGEDKHPLDVFIGTGGIHGYFQVYRPDVEGEVEHKFCLNLTEQEEAQILQEFRPVLRNHGRFSSFQDLVSAIEQFKVSS